MHYLKQINQKVQQMNNISLNQITNTTAYQVSSQEPTTNYFTEVKIQRYALNFFIALASVAAVTLIGTSIAGIITWPLAFLAIPLFVAAYGAMYFGSTLKDFDDPTELASLKQKALALDFSSLDKEYSSYGGVTCLLHKKVLTVEEFKVKFKQELGGTFSINEFLSKFGSNAIDTYTSLRVLSPEEASGLASVKHNQNALEYERSQKAKQTDLKYPTRLDNILAALQKEENQLINQFNKRKEQVQEIGDSLSYGAAFGIKHDPKKEESRYETYMKGVVLTDLATIAVGLAGEKELNKRLATIEKKRIEARNDKVATDLQIQYNEEITKITEEYELKRVPLLEQFHQAKSKIIQS